MSTRSNIVMKKGDKYHVIYTHWDGSPSNNGAILLEHYQNPQKIWQLIQLGDISILGAEIGEKHDFDKPPEGVVTAYHRDRGEDLEHTDYRTFDTKEEALNACDNDYTYLAEDG